MILKVKTNLPDKHGNRI